MKIPSRSRIGFGIADGFATDAAYVAFTGAAAQQGDFYFNTTLDTLRIYTSAGFSSLTTTATPVVANLWDTTDTTLPTGSVTIDSVTVTDGMLVLFTNLSSGNNEIYQAAVLAGNVTGWTAQQSFNNSVTPFDGAFSFITQGTVYANTLVYFNGTTWVSYSAGFANAALSNLSSVAINTSLLPGSSNSINLGSSALLWAIAYANSISAGFSEPSINVLAGQLVDQSSNPQLSWSTTGIEFNQLTPLTVPYLSAGNILTSSSVTPTQLGYLSGATGTTGTGELVFQTSPMLITPDLGTPSAGVLTNATGLPISSGLTGSTQYAVILGAASGELTSLPTNASTAFPLISGGSAANPSWALLSPAGGGTGSPTVPSSGQIPVGNVGGTAYAPETVSGDATLSSTGALTLATVATAGTTGSSTSIPAITINAKGLVTSVSGNAVVAPAGTLTGTTLASNVTASSLTSLGNLVGLLTVTNETHSGYNANQELVDATTTGVGATLNSAAQSFVVVTKNTLTSLSMIPAGSNGQQLILSNQTGAAITVNNQTGGTAANWITTGTGANLTLANDASLWLAYDNNTSTWLVIGGSGGGGFAYLASNTSTYGGTNSVLSFTGADNTVIGVSAGNALTSGADNVIIGYKALLDATTVTQSVVIGSTAGGTAVATYSNNVVIGYEAGLTLTTGSVNIFIGHLAANGVTTGGNNVVIGGATTSGSFGATFANNTTVGVAAGSSAATGANSGSSNTSIGYQAGAGNGISVTGNTIIGATAGSGNVSSSNNTFVGSNAVGFSNGGGGGNCTVIGAAAGFELGTGANNTFVGFETGYFISSGHDNTLLGYKVNNVLVGITSTIGTVGIGSTSIAGANYSIVIGYNATDNSNVNTIAIGQGEPGTGFTGCITLGETTTGVAVVTTTASNQMAIGTSGTNAIPISAVYIGRGAVGDGTTTNISIQPSPVVGANLTGANFTHNAGNSTGTGAGGSHIFQTAAASGVSSSTANTYATALTIDSNANLVQGTAALATTATNGFMYLESCAGVPTGVPTSFTGRIPMVIDSSNSEIYIYNAGWQAIGGGPTYRANSATVGSGVTSVAVTFSSTIGTTNYAITAQFVNTTDASPQFQPITITAKSATGFTASWNAPTATANYLISYNAIVNQ